MNLLIKNLAVFCAVWLASSSAASILFCQFCCLPRQLGRRMACSRLLRHCAKGEEEVIIRRMFFVVCCVVDDINIKNWRSLEFMVAKEVFLVSSFDALCPLCPLPLHCAPHAFRCVFLLFSCALHVPLSKKDWPPRSPRVMFPLVGIVPMMYVSMSYYPGCVPTNSDIKP